SSTRTLQRAARRFGRSWRTGTLSRCLHRSTCGRGARRECVPHWSDRRARSKANAARGWHRGASMSEKPGGRITVAEVHSLDFSKGDGLLPAVVQDAESGAVLMVGYMNRDALRETFSRRRVVFFSRSKGRLWEKGETSGHTLDLVEVR